MKKSLFRLILLMFVIVCGSMSMLAQDDFTFPLAKLVEDTCFPAGQLLCRYKLGTDPCEFGAVKSGGIGCTLDGQGLAMPPVQNPDGTVSQIFYYCNATVPVNTGNCTIQGDPFFPVFTFCCILNTGDPCIGSDGSSYTAPDGQPVPNCSPIIIDTEGEGFHLTSAANGVMFDIRGDDHPVQIAWTAPGSHNAFLALPGSDGLVHNGKQLFGNFTPQPQSALPNGFLALAQFDKAENGGNGDSIIDNRDAVYSKLRLWIDENHDGICQLNELHTLPELGVLSLSLEYLQDKRRDEFGNQFRYRAKVNPLDHDKRDDALEVGRWAYDVFLMATGK